MANDIIMTVSGRTTADIDLRYTQGGRPVGNFTVASNARHFDKQKNEWVDDEPTFLRCSVWGDYAENAAASIPKGTHVIVTGRYKQRSYEDRDGNKRTSTELEVDELGVALRYAQAAVQRIQRDSSQTRQQPSAYQQEQDEAWATPQQAQDVGVATGQPTFDEPWATPGAANEYGDDTPF